MKVSDQLKQARRGFDISNHAFLTRIAQAIAERIESDSGLPLAMVGKEVTGSKISVTLVGQSSAENLDEMKERVRQTMQTMKNPTALTDLLR